MTCRIFTSMVFTLAGCTANTGFEPDRPGRKTYEPSLELPTRLILPVSSKSQAIELFIAASTPHNNPPGTQIRAVTEREEDWLIVASAAPPGRPDLRYGTFGGRVVKATGEVVLHGASGSQRTP